MSKDWTGNKKTTFATLGASSHSDHERETHDYYATDPVCAIDLIRFMERIGEPLPKRVWEPACGEGHLAKVFVSEGYEVTSSDLIDRGYGTHRQVDFLRDEPLSKNCAIITNPPYKYAQEFVERALGIVTPPAPVCMFLKLTFLEGQKRQKLFVNGHLKYVAVYAARQKCAINGNFANTGSSAACYAWFIWDKSYSGLPMIDWVDRKSEVGNQNRLDDFFQ
jgi:hypothetical protein